MTGSPAGRTLCTHGEGWGLLQGEPEGKAAILGVEFSAEKEEDILPRDVCLPAFCLGPRGASWAPPEGSGFE